MTFFRLAPLLVALSLSCSSLAAETDERVTLNFVNADIESTIKAVGVITGKNFVIDPKVKGNINIVSSQPVARELIYPILLSALRQQGFTAIENNAIVKVMPDIDAKTQALQVFTRHGKGGGDKIVTQIFPLSFESATQLANTLRPLVTSYNFIAAYQGNNTLVVTDYADNVGRIGQIVANIDQPQSNDVFALPIKHASALDIAQTLGKLLPEVFVQGVASPMQMAEGVRKTVVVPDVRGNQLLVRSEAAAHAKQIKSLVASLDTPSASGSNINVVYLRNAEAIRLAATLKGILTGQDSGSQALSQSGAASHGGASGGFATVSGSASTTLPGGINPPLAANPSGTTVGGQALSSAVNVQVGGASVLIQADSMTNSLVITAPDHVYNNLRSVIDKLDVRRAQIYIEALIAEVSLSKSTELGVQWLTAGGNDNLGGAALSAMSPNGNNLTNLYSGYKAGTLSIPLGFNLGLFNGDPRKGTASLGVLATAIEKNGDGNILSTPNLLMLDNEEAKITVGQNIPILTGSYTTTATGSSNPFQTVERKDIGVKLRIKPQVSDSGTITLSVAQEVSSIDETVNTNGAGIATKVRVIETKVLVDDGQTIVLGGLIQDKVSMANNKVPVLGDVPVLGHLFRYGTQGREKVNLMVFLRPAVLRDAKSSQALASERYEYLRAVQGRFSEQNNVLLETPSRVLPPAAVATQTPAPESRQP